jgi:hypothetical protein
MKCELCGAAAELYGTFPTCKECGTTVCTECIEPDSRDTDYDHDTAICKDCSKEAEDYRLARLKEQEYPHASDCATWMNCPCDCVTAARIRGDE